jgi:hypothetical protein
MALITIACYLAATTLCLAESPGNLPQSKLTVVLPIDDMESLSSDAVDAILTIRIINELYPDAQQLAFVLSYHRVRNMPDEGRKLYDGDRYSLTGPTVPDRFEVSGVRPGYRLLSIRVTGATPEAISNVEDTIHLEAINLPYGQYIIASHAETRTSDGMLHDSWIQKLEVGLVANEAKIILVHHPGTVQTIKDAFFSREGAFLTAIFALLAALGAAVKKELERLTSRAIDWLGGYGIRAAATRKFRRIYLDHLVSSHRYLRLVGFNVAGLPRPLLEEVYISLRVNSYGTKLGDRDATKGGTVSFVDGVRRFDRLVILGAPGSGKTTTLGYIVLRFAQHRGSPFFERSLLPIYIPLRRLSPTTATILADLLDAKTQILPEEVLQAYPRNFFEQKLSKGECIVLFDGLDEVTNEGVHRHVAERINAFVDRYNKNRVVVTCRVAGWRNLLPAFTVLEADDLSYDEVHRFVHGWHTAIISLQERNRIEQEYSEQETRRLRWQESVPRDAMGQAARRWHHRRCG